MNAQAPEVAIEGLLAGRWTWSDLPVAIKGPTFRYLRGFVRREEEKNPDRFRWIYAIQAGDDGPVKIGVTVNPPERLATLQQANAAELRPLGLWRGPTVEEKQLHDEFAHARIRGEWFRPVSELVSLVQALNSHPLEWEKE